MYIWLLIWAFFWGFYYLYLISNSIYPSVLCQFKVEVSSSPFAVWTVLPFPFSFSLGYFLVLTFSYHLPFSSWLQPFPYLGISELEGWGPCEQLAYKECLSSLYPGISLSPTRTSFVLWSMSLRKSWVSWCEQSSDFCVISRSTNKWVQKKQTRP